MRIPLVSASPILRRPRRVARPTLALIALGLALAATAGCTEKPRARFSRVPVTVATVEQREMPFALVSTGTVEPIETAAVGSQVGGVITRVVFHEGDEVATGQLLFQLDPRPFRAALDEALATLAKDLAQAETARLNAERNRTLKEQNLISQAEWDQTRATEQTWTATVRADSAAVLTARLNLEYSSIRAPISGRTGRFMVHEGDYVKAATADPLVTINQIHPVRVVFTVPVSAVSLVQRYRATQPRVIVQAPGASAPYEGGLVFVDNAVDAASGTLLLKGEFANTDGRLTPGEFVNVRLVLYVQPQATVVPAPAVTSGQQGTYVYVLNSDSTVTPRPVSVERTVDQLAVLTDGLKPGETVVTDGQLRLAPGSKVMVRAGVGDPK